MEHDDLARIRRAHAEALRLKPEEREQFFKSHFPGHPELEEEVRRLVAAHEQSGDFLKTPLIHHVVPAGRDLRALRIGPYELIKPLGQGGSAAVYLAKRVDDLFERQVAIKVLSRLTYSEEAFLRFQREVQILARVEHAYIVRLIEAGTTGEALAYIVTELIEGETLDRAAASLSIADKVRLFVKICDGVAAAHRNLVVHRDLKPTNILVTANGTPKILDFGIALLLDREANLTQTGFERMTAHYASPEQLRGDRPITTASDVYSLGVLLGDLVMATPTRRTPAELRAIVGKAMNTHPARRYESVDGLRDDLIRMLHGEAVLAHGEGRVYKLRKLASKHWLLLSASLAILALIFSLSMRSLAASSEAKRQSARVKELLSEVLGSMTTDRENHRSLRALRIVDETRLRYLASLATEYPDDRQLAVLRFDTWRGLGNIQGLPSSVNLGDTANASESLRRAVQAGEAIMARWPEGEFPREMALTYIELGSVLLEMDRTGEAMAEFERAGRVGARLKNPFGKRAYLEALAQDSRILVRQGKLRDALELRRQVVDERRKLFTKDPDGLQWEFPGALCSYGELLREMGRLQEAAAAYGEAVPMIERLGERYAGTADNPWHIARENEEYGKTLLALKLGSQAERYLNRAVSLYRQLRSDEPDGVSNQRALAVCLHELATYLLEKGDRNRARTLVAEAATLSSAAAQIDKGSVRAQREAEMIRATLKYLGPVTPAGRVSTEDRRPPG